MNRFLRRQFAAVAVAGLLAGPVFAGGEGWTEDFAGAKQTASADGKDLLMDFTGSDWCGWCIKLNEEVFSYDEFKAYADENFVLVELDYPNAKPQSEEIKAQNAELQKTYAIKGYPTIILADAQGRPYAQTGYQPGGPVAYVEHLTELKQARINRDEQLEAAQHAEGIQKARHLHEALQVVGDELAVTHYRDTIQQIVALDADNAEGLKQHYTDLITANDQKQELNSIMAAAGGDVQGAIQKIDEMLTRQDLLKSIRQELITAKSSLYMFALQDKEAAYNLIKEAIEVDPDSDLAKSLHDVLKSYFPDKAE